MDLLGHGLKVAARPLWPFEAGRDAGKPSEVPITSQ